MNEIIFIASGIIAFFGVSIVARLFGRVGLIAWVAVSTVLANIAVAKQATMFGMDVTLGNIMFSSTYLATDILSEVYGRKESRKAVYTGLVSAVGFVVFGLIVNSIIPNDYDFAGESMSVIMSFSIRTTTASVIFFFLSNLADVWLFDKFRKHSTKNLWLRNNVCTIFCNCAENFLFTFAAFYGIFDAQTCASISICTCVMEIIAGLIDTPFCYLGRRWALLRND